MQPGDEFGLPDYILPSLPFWREILKSGERVQEAETTVKNILHNGTEKDTGPHWHCLMQKSGRASAYSPLLFSYNSTKSSDS